MHTTPHIYVDADACPVKEEIYKVAKRYRLPVTLVANACMNTPDDEYITLVKVDQGFDEADEWIIEQAQAHDIVITTDIPMASACLKQGAHVLNPKGRIFNEETIGEALASREVSAQLREHGLMSGGPAPFGPKDCSRFLQALDATIHAAQREA